MLLKIPPIFGSPANFVWLITLQSKAWDWLSRPKASGKQDRFVGTLPQTNSSSLNSYLSKKKFIFQPLIFRGDFFNFREGICFVLLVFSLATRFDW